MRISLAALALTPLLVSISSAAQSGPPQVGFPPDEAAASRFLARSTFGATPETIAELMQIGYVDWFETQLNAPISMQRPEVEAQFDPEPSAVYANDQVRKEMWWQAVILGRDQLRQKMAWALSQIMVVSVQDTEVFNEAIGTSDYYDRLSLLAFGNFRDLLDMVTLHPVMGQYLDMLGNSKTDLENGIRPDENYAREVLQLFSIGLVELEPDGSVRLDDFGEPIPTYDQTIVEGFAKVFTGWTHAGKASFNAPIPKDPILRGATPMELYPEFHDPAAKPLLSGVVLPAGQSGELDLDQALDNIFEHPNVGPFISKLLIQRLVTSNPSPAYVERVAAVFDDDGTGVRGSLLAVARAIVSDPEARLPLDLQPEGYGKLRDPLLRQVALWRAFDAQSSTGEFGEWLMFEAFAQAPLEAPSVFNFYAPDYSPQGEISDAGLASPEFQITTHKKIADVTNQIMKRVLEGYQGFPYASPESVLLDLEPLRLMANDPMAIVDEIDLLLLGGALSDGVRAAVVAHVESISMDEYASIGVLPGMQRAVEALALITTSSEAAVQR